MVVDCLKHILLECPSCKELKTYDLNYFELASESYLEYSCDCEDLNLRISKLDKGSIVMNIHCSICERVHIYEMTLDRLFHKNSCLSCGDGTRICIIGDRKLVDKYMSEISLHKSGSGQCDLPVLMKKLYDLGEEKKISCSCGSKDLEAKVYSHKLDISCKDCQKSRSYSLTSSKDVRSLLETDEIVLGKKEVVSKQ